MKIDKYRFGRIVIDGKKYTNDIIVFHDHVSSGWWRSNGHKLQREDLDEILAAKPTTLIVGCGAIGALRIPEETRRFLADNNVRLIDLRSGAACKEYNNHSSDPGVVGAFHLTC